MTSPEEWKFKVCSLGKVAMHCRDFAAMTAFYEEFLGLERLRPGGRGGFTGNPEGNTVELVAANPSCHL